MLDTTHAESISSAPAIKLAAGQAIAFDATGRNTLSFDSTTGTLRCHQGDLSYPVGKGITVGWQIVISQSTTLFGFDAGRNVFLTGTGAYTITLPPANTVAFGTGFTFSVIGTGTPTVSIVPSGTDGIDCGPVVLRAYDRYHVVSDNYNTWREVLRTNAVSPRFTAPIVLPSYTVATLPSGVPAGAKAYATNGRKPSDSVGPGTGIEVFFDGMRWISTCAGTTVVA